MTYLITPSKLYAYLQCPHRPWRDLYGPQEEKIKETNPFVEMLWEKGVQHEKDVIGGIGAILDLSNPDKDTQFARTLEAMRNKTPLIYHGYIRYNDLAGEPDLLRLMPDGTYLPIDIKSGRGLEGVSEEEENPGKPKKHYAVQLALYAEVLIALGFAKDKMGIIYDIDHNETLYELGKPMGVRNHATWWDLYQETKNEVRHLLNNEARNEPALSGACKLCPWYDSCKGWCTKNHDLTTLFYLGRSIRGTLAHDLELKTVEELRDLDIAIAMGKKAGNKSFLRGIGEPTLKKLQTRAKVLADIKKPVVNGEIHFPQVDYELYFDIEDDPTQSFVYLHGVYERSPNGSRFIPFVAKEKTPEAEEQAWKGFISYLKNLPQDKWCLYYYSHHEVTTYHRMQKQYPDVILLEELDYLLSPERAIDLYSQYILKMTDWPLYSYSLKDIAKYLGFSWRDISPSGALSIQWFNEYLKDKNPTKLRRIIDYNEDDCKATMVIKDYLEKSK